MNPKVQEIANSTRDPCEKITLLQKIITDDFSDPAAGDATVLIGEIEQHNRDALKACYEKIPRYRKLGGKRTKRNNKKRKTLRKKSMRRRARR